MTKFFYNGNFINPLNFNDSFEMLGTKNGKITYKGKFDKSIIKETDTLINLKGNTLLPGFNDSHIHLLGLGQSLNQLKLDKASSIEEVIALGKKFIKNNNPKILLGRGWNQENFISKRMLTKKDLNKITNDIPIILRRACGHVLVVNTKALDFIKDPNLVINGGDFSMETGIFKENAMDLILNQIPEPSIDTLKKFFIDGALYLRKLGVTSVQSDDLCVYPINMSEKIINILDSFSKKFPLRVYEQSLFRNNNNFKKFISNGYKMTENNDYINYGPLKILLDGALGSKTAYLTDNYKNDNHKGILMYSEKELYDLIKTANSNKIDVAIHAIGDGAINLAIESIEKLPNEYDHRHSIIHCQITNKNIINKMADLNILAHIQPIFLDKDIHIINDRLPKDRISDTYAFKTMMNKNINVSFGSDAPVDYAAPLLGIHVAVNRTDLNGFPENGWQPKEKLSIKEAIYNYTYASAYAERQEKNKGALEINYYADFVILDKNPLTIDSKKIKEINVVTTYVDGNN